MSENLEELTLEEAWQLAIEKERQAQEMYRTLAEKVTESGARELFEFLVKQEEEHERRLQDEFDRAFRPEW